MSIMDHILDEMDYRGAYQADLYVPHFVSSYAVHAFNLMNQRNKVYWESSEIKNSRLHILFIAPPGFMKSYFIGQMGMSEFGIFTNCSNVSTAIEQSMSEAGFVGTIQNVNGQVITVDGAANIHREAILMIDEFAAITNAFKSTYNNQMDSHFLTALDSGHVTKRLGSGTLDYYTHLTLWAGVQPARFDLESGMGRRFWYLMNMPTKEDSDALIDAMYRTENVRGDKARMSKLWNIVDVWTSKFDIIKRVEFAISNKDMVKKLNLYHYETSLFKLFALGHHLATYGPEEKIVVDYNDSDLLELFKKQKSWRRDIIRGADLTQLGKMILECGDVVEDNTVRITRRRLIDECIMIGWNAKQVNEKLTEMLHADMVKIKGNDIFMVE